MLMGCNVKIGREDTLSCLQRTVDECVVLDLLDKLERVRLFINILELCELLLPLIVKIFYVFSQ